MKPESLFIKKSMLAAAMLLSLLFTAGFGAGAPVRALAAQTAQGAAGSPSTDMPQTSAIPQTYDADRRGTITIELEDLGTDRADVSLLLYRVGVFDADSPSVHFLWTEELDGIEALADVDLDHIITADDTRQAAAVLENVLRAADAPLASLETQVTDADGVARFGLDADGEGTLEPGMYFLMQDKENGQSTDTYGVISSLLVPLPCSDDGQAVTYDLVLMPKAAENLPEGYYREEPTTERSTGRRNAPGRTGQKKRKAGKDATPAPRGPATRARSSCGASCWRQPSWDCWWNFGAGERADDNYGRERRDILSDTAEKLEEFCPDPDLPGTGGLSHGTDLQPAYPHRHPLPGAGGHGHEDGPDL